jgi:hypothetical protein
MASGRVRKCSNRRRRRLLDGVFQRTTSTNWLMSFYLPAKNGYQPKRGQLMKLRHRLATALRYFMSSHASLHATTLFFHSCVVVVIVVRRSYSASRNRSDRKTASRMTNEYFPSSIRTSKYLPRAVLAIKDAVLSRCLLVYKRQFSVVRSRKFNIQMTLSYYIRLRKPFCCSLGRRFLSLAVGCRGLLRQTGALII